MTTSNEHNNAPAVPQGAPEINYPALIEAAFAKNRKWTQGTTGCIAFARGAEWFREQAIAAAPASAPAQDEPFGYFRSEPFGWTDCAEDDEGAIALYERPQEVGLTDEGRQQVFIAAERRMVREPNLSWRDAIVDEVIAALRAKGQS